MKQKTIRAICRKKIDEIIKALPSNLSDTERYKLTKLIKDNIFITGGAITSMLQDEEVHDFDCYFKTPEACYTIAKFYSDWWKHRAKNKLTKTHDNTTELMKGVEDLPIADRVYIMVKSQGIAKDYHNYDYEDNPSYQKRKPNEPAYITSNAITLMKEEDKPGTQFVIRFFGTPDEIHKNYDFVHTTNYYDYAKNELVVNEKALSCILSKELKYQGSRYPVCSLFRIRKFIKRGWTISAMEMFKIIFQVSQLDLTKPEVLADQLAGVDYVYFEQVIRKIKARPSEKPIGLEELNDIVDEVIESIDSTDEYEG